MCIDGFVLGNKRYELQGEMIDASKLGDVGKISLISGVAPLD
jgi:hypothetical protein